MKTIKHILFIIAAIVSFNLSAQNTLTGKVIDSTDKSGLPGAVIYIPDLKQAAQTTNDGTYSLNDLPKGTFVVEVHILGYKVVSMPIKIDGATTQNFTLIPSEFQEDEVVITGTSRATEAEHNPQPIADVTN